MFLRLKYEKIQNRTTPKDTIPSQLNTLNGPQSTWLDWRVGQYAAQTQCSHSDHEKCLFWGVTSVHCRTSMATRCHMRLACSSSTELTWPNYFCVLCLLREERHRKQTPLHSKNIIKTMDFMMDFLFFNLKILLAYIWKVLFWLLVWTN